MTKSAAFLLIASVGVSIAGCATTNGAPCDGWSPGRPNQRTMRYILANDPAFAEWVISHNEHGEKICRWRARN